MGVVGSIWRQAQRELDTNSAIQDSKPGQPRKTNKNHHQLGCDLSCDSVSRTYILGPDTTYTYRIKTSEAGVVGVAPTGSPTFCLNFCLHWVQLSPRNCMDLHTRGCRHGIYQMCRIMIRSVHFNRGNARNAVARRLHVLPPTNADLLLCSSRLSEEGGVGLAGDSLQGIEEGEAGDRILTGSTAGGSPGKLCRPNHHRLPPLPLLLQLR